MTTDYSTESFSFQVQPEIPNQRFLEEFGRNGSYVLSSETQSHISKLNERKNKFKSLAKPRTRHQHRIQPYTYERDVYTEESHRLLQELNQKSAFIDMQTTIKPRQVIKPSKKNRKTTRTAPAAGFKSLYQLSLMLGKGFNIDDLYLVQDSFSKEDLNRRNKNTVGPLPFSTVNPPVTVVPIKPQVPSTRFEPLPIDYVATIKPLRKEAREMFRLYNSANFGNEIGFDIDEVTNRNSVREIIKTIDPELARVDDDVDKLQLPKEVTSRLSVLSSAKSKQGSGDIETRSVVSAKSRVGFGNLDMKSNKPKSSIISLGPCSSMNSTKPASSAKTRRPDSGSSVSCLSRSGLLRKDIYELTPDNSEDEYTSSEDEGVAEDEDEDDISIVSEYEPNEMKKMLDEEIKKMTLDHMIMFNTKNTLPVLKQQSITNTNDVPSSRESTKAHASLTSRVGLDDVNSDDTSTRGEECQMQSSECAHPLCNTVTPGTVMKTYEQVIGKDITKGAQRSHTFSGRESKSKKGKERLAMSFPTIFHHE